MDDKLKIAAELEHFFQEMLEVCSKQCDDAQKLFAVSLGCQCLSNFQAVILLVKNRKDEEARMIIRSFWEAIVRLAATVKEKDFILKVVYAEDHKSKNRLKRVSPNTETDEMIQAVEEKLKQVDLKTLLDTPKGWFDSNGGLILDKVATDCGLSDIHKHHALYYGWSVHVNNRRVARFLKFDLTGKWVGMNFDPDPTDINGVLFKACNLLVGAMIELRKLFQIDMNEAAKKWVSMFEELPPGWEA